MKIHRGLENRIPIQIVFDVAASSHGTCICVTVILESHICAFRMCLHNRDVSNKTRTRHHRATSSLSVTVLSGHTITGTLFLLFSGQTSVLSGRNIGDLSGWCFQYIDRIDITWFRLIVKIKYLALLIVYKKRPLLVSILSGGNIVFFPLPLPPPRPPRTPLALKTPLTRPPQPKRLSPLIWALNAEIFWPLPLPCCTKLAKYAVVFAKSFLWASEPVTKALPDANKGHYMSNKNFWTDLASRIFSLFRDKIRIFFSKIRT